MATKTHAITLNDNAFEQAKTLITEGKAVVDQRDDWSEHQPTREQENRFIAEHGMTEYARWHLGVDNEKQSDNKTGYKFPYGDFVSVHRCAVLSAGSRAGQYKHTDIELACAHLHGMLDAIR